MKYFFNLLVIVFILSACSSQTQGPSGMEIVSEPSSPDYMRLTKPLLKSHCFQNESASGEFIVNLKLNKENKNEVTVDYKIIKSASKNYLPNKVINERRIFAEVMNLGEEQNFIIPFKDLAIGKYVIEVQVYSEQGNMERWGYFSFAPFEVNHNSIITEQ